MSITPLDYAVFLGYFVFVISIALWVSRKPKDHERTSEDFFLAGRALPWWIIGTSLIASNISAEQMIGMTGSAFAGGLAVVSYEWMAAVTLIIVAKWMLPVFLKMKIYSMPQYLEERFDMRVSMGLAVFWLLVYVFVNLTSVSYLGALTLKNIIGPDFTALTGLEFKLIYGIVGLFLVSFIYTLTGGLTAVAWTDVIQVSVLFIGGLAVTYFGLNAMSDGGGVAAGFANLWNQAPEHFHTVMPWDHIHYPWIGVFIGGMWAANLSYWGCNQYITQRALAGKNLKEAQHGLVFAAFLKVIVPIVVLLPGIVAYALYSDSISQSDQAYSILISKLVPAGFTGLIVAAIVAAIISSLNSMVNSTATIFTMDIFRKINPHASERLLVLIGRITSVVVVCIAIPIAPFLGNLDQAFQYIQEYTGMVSPGIVVIFFFGLFWKRATSASALWMAILTIPVSAALKFIPIYLIPDTILGRFLDPFLNRMGVAMLILFVVGYFISIMTEHTVHEEYDKMEESVSYKTSTIFKVCSILIMGVLTALYLTFF
ncbi:MAG: sodium/solute symporter [Candidatus Omnitrophica bacterium]|nr:sodium/solute symporter [Candidatus Omnitrophota bacterium]